MFYPIFHSPQVKRCAIITYKHDMYELPHELLNDVRLRILVNYKIPGKYQNLIEWHSAPSSPSPKTEIPSNTSKKLLKNRN